jgi:hypothetical protein
MLFSYAVSLLLVCLGLFIGWGWKVSEKYESAKTNATTPLERALPFAPKMVFVGRITGMVECTFPEDKDVLPPPSRNAFVPLGRRYNLQSGLMEITYDAGARVILQGPVLYEVESANGGFLSFGKLTARVEKNDERGLMNDELRKQVADIHPSSFITHPLFSVSTPLAVVTDLGTEFGVECDSSGATRSHVFQGLVELRVASEGGQSGQSISLQENESARVESVGNHIVKVTREESREKSLPTSFVRRNRFSIISTTARVRAGPRFPGLPAMRPNRSK